MKTDQFSAGDKVCFVRDGQTLTGVVVATGVSPSDSIVVETGPGSENRFHVPPHLLQAA